MSKIADVISRHKGLFIVTVLSFVLFIIILIIFLIMLLGVKPTVYGSRLDGIEEVELTNNELTSIKESIKEVEKVTNAVVRAQGKIVYVHIYYENGTDKNLAKDIATDTLELFAKDVLGYYDLEYFLIEDKKEDALEEDTTFVITGNKHPVTDGISWIKS